MPCLFTGTYHIYGWEHCETSPSGRKKGCDKESLKMLKQPCNKLGPGLWVLLPMDADKVCGLKLLWLWASCCPQIVIRERTMQNHPLVWIDAVLNLPNTKYFKKTERILIYIITTICLLNKYSREIIKCQILCYMVETWDKYNKFPAFGNLRM